MTEAGEINYVFPSFHHQWSLRGEGGWTGKIWWVLVAGYMVIPKHHMLKFWRNS